MGISHIHLAKSKIFMLNRAVLFVLLIGAFYMVPILSPNDWKNSIYDEKFYNKTDDPNFFSPSLCVFWPCAVRNVAPSGYDENIRPSSFVDQDYQVIKISGTKVFVPDQGMCWNIGPLCIPRFNKLNLQKDNLEYSFNAINN